MTTYVAVDLETTGLQPGKDAIIEVAAIAFADGQVLGEYQSLVNPERDLDSFIINLTGITQRMVNGAPVMYDVRPHVRQMMADHVVIGHNVGFDMGFLEQERIGVGQHRIDTVTLASILLPGVGRYSLEALARFLGLPSLEAQQTHRALDDARLTVELFWALTDLAHKLPFSTIEEIVQAGQRIGWPETIFFQDVLRARGRDAFGERPSRRTSIFQPEWPNAPTLNEKEDPEPIDVEMIADMLLPDGNFGRQFPDYEYREEQVAMLMAVGEALNQGDKLLVEAGTGTGKSIGYLMPAAFWAAQNGRRVVVSTATINLQDQLIHKDIPTLQRILPFELRATVLKGKRNYICTRLFKQMRHTGPRDATEMTLFARILIWLPDSLTGDVAQISLRSGPERFAWNRLNAENDVCTRDMCAEERCPLHLARRRAQQAHIIVANHSLLMADMKATVLPDYKDVILDEAHHLEAAVTDGLSFRADRRFLETLVGEFTGRSGLLGDIEKKIVDLPEFYRDKVDSYLVTLRQIAEQGQRQIDEFFLSLDFFIRDQIDSRSQFSQAVRLTPSSRTLPDFDHLLLSWENLGLNLANLVKGLMNIAEGLNDINMAVGLAEGDELQLAVRNSAGDLHETIQNIHQIIADPSPDMIYWVEVMRDRLSLHAAPLHVGPLVEEHLFAELESVVLTSATMRTANANSRRGEPTFDYIRERLHAHDALELAVGSPFDYPDRALVYLVSDIPEPNQPGYQRYVEDAILQVAEALGGRTMVLFTSYGHLNVTARAVEGLLAERGITLLAQTEGSSRQQLLDRFKTPGTRAVLMGTKSFWEGVDVPGEALQAVLIARIPFDVPSDPVFAARSETFDNSFFEYSIPEAVLRFRQGFGRLIRRKSDEGVVVILDKRILTKRYGEKFLEALPECTVIRQRTERLGELTQRWFNRQRRG
ncbi:MAG: DEAD/DEAH box helicase family protein [Anaerolineales bacterium]|nr:DEAD/DEAH box helicase family protein [Anaerolineales bacterium]